MYIVDTKANYNKAFDKGYSDDDVQFCTCISDHKLMQLKLNYVADLINDQIRESRDH